MADEMGSLKDLLGELDAEEAALLSGLTQDMATASTPPTASETVPDFGEALVRAIAVGLPTLFARGLGGKTAGGAAATIGRQSLENFEEIDRKSAGSKQRQAAAQAELKKEQLKTVRKRKGKIEDREALLPLEVKEAREKFEATLPGRKELADITASAQREYNRALMQERFSSDQREQALKITDEIRKDLKAAGSLEEKAVLIGQARAALSAKNNFGFANLQSVLPRIYGEKGVLSDKDIKRAFPSALKQDVEKIKNYFSGETTDLATEPQREAVIKLLALQAGKIRQEIRNVASSTFLRSRRFASSLNEDERRGVITDFVKPKLLSLDEKAIQEYTKKDGTRWRGRLVLLEDGTTGLEDIERLDGPEGDE